MSVVVSDTSPLHYLILCEAEEILPKLFRQVLIPPKVFEELQQKNTPSSVRAWASSLPSWIVVRKPKSLLTTLSVHSGELEAISLAQEVKAKAILMDDRAARTAAARCGLAVVGTVGLLERAAELQLIDLSTVAARLQQTNARLDPKLIAAALDRDNLRKKSR